ncbi:Hypothetical protein A7982_04384 [Minicystis rosea]|nr:Hypothetical protein A7982_04384 [Minicystis rosea]
MEPYRGGLSGTRIPRTEGATRVAGLLAGSHPESEAVAWSPVEVAALTDGARLPSTPEKSLVSGRGQGR